MGEPVQIFQEMEEDYLIPLIKIEDELVKIHKLDANRGGLAGDGSYGYDVYEQIEEAENAEYPSVWDRAAHSIYSYRWYKYGTQRNIYRFILETLPDAVVADWRRRVEADLTNSHKVMDEVFAYDYRILDSLDRLIDENRNKVDTSQYQMAERRFMHDPQYKLWQYFKDEKDLEKYSYYNVVPPNGYYWGLYGFCETVSRVKGFWNGYIAFHAHTFGGWGRSILSLIAEGWIDSGIPVLEVSKDFVDMITHVVDKYSLDVGFDKDVFIPQEFKYDELPKASYEEGQKLLYKYGDEYGKRDRYADYASLSENCGEE